MKDIFKKQKYNNVQLDVRTNQTKAHKIAKLGTK